MIVGLHPHRFAEGVIEVEGLLRGDADSAIVLPLVFDMGTQGIRAYPIEDDGYTDIDPPTPPPPPAESNEDMAEATA